MARTLARSAYPSRGCATLWRPSVPGTLIPLRVGGEVATDEGSELDVRLEHDLRRARSRRRHVPGNGHCGASHVDQPQPLPWLGHAVDDIDQPLHVVEFQPQRIVEVDVRLVRTSHPERESSPVRQVGHQQRAIGTSPQYQACRNQPWSSGLGASCACRKRLGRGVETTWKGVWQ